MNEQRSLAKCCGFDFSTERTPSLCGFFEYEEGFCQGFGFFIDIAFLYRFCRVFNVDKLSKVNGKSCWVTHSNDQIFLIEPLHKKDGIPLDVIKWQSWIMNQLKSPLTMDRILNEF